VSSKRTSLNPVRYSTVTALAGALGAAEGASISLLQGFAARGSVRTPTPEPLTEC
jgi:hypothetical protein